MVNKITCKYCPKEFNTWIAVIRHVRRNHPDEYKVIQKTQEEFLKGFLGG